MVLVFFNLVKTKKVSADFYFSPCLHYNSKLTTGRVTICSQLIGRIRVVLYHMGSSSKEKSHPVASRENLTLCDECDVSAKIKGEGERDRTCSFCCSS